MLRSTASPLCRLGKTFKYGNKQYRCVKEKICKASVTINGETIIRMANQHSHMPDQDSIEARKCLEEIKTRSIDTNQKPRQILLTCQRNVKESTAAALPTVEAMCQTI